MHYYQFNIGDYIANTARLSNTEDLCYRRLLDLYYLNEQAFNECCNSVAREIGMVEHLDSVEFVLNKYFELDGGFWRQKRADREISAYQSKSKSASKAGKASGKARKLKASEQTFNDRCKTDQPNIKHKTLNTKHKTLLNYIDQSVIDHDFDLFWNSGIRKVNKKKSKSLFSTLFKKSTKGAHFTKMLVNDVKARIDSNQLGFSELHPTTYLNGERWNDAIIKNVTINGERGYSLDELGEAFING